MNHLSTLTLGFICLLAIFSCQNNGTPQITEEDREALRYLKEVEWPKAYAEQDTVLLDRILGEDFEMIDIVGARYGKADELEWIKTNAIHHDSFHYEIKRFDILSNGTAIVGGTGHIINDSVLSTYESSNVLVKLGEDWKAVLSHVSGFRSEVEDEIKAVHRSYVDAWKTDDQEALMALIHEEAMIQPGSLAPVEGKEAIEAFWFPEDGGRTVIQEFETDILDTQVLNDTLALSMHHSLLDWDYEKGETRFGRVQEAVVTTIYRRMPDDTWRIWRSMWADHAVSSK